MMDFGFRLGSLRGHFLGSFGKKGSPFCIQFCRSLLELLRGLFWSPNNDFGYCFGRLLGRLGPWKIMPKCTTICIFRVWALLERSLFPDPLLEGFWHAFGQIWCRLGHSLGACGPLFQRLRATFVACRFPMFFGGLPGPVKISSRAKVDGIYVPFGPY